MLILFLSDSNNKIYNPQNELLRLLETKCTVLQNEMSLKNSFNLSIKQFKVSESALFSETLKDIITPL